MIKRAHRLSSAQFLDVMNKGRVGHSSPFLVRTLKTDEGVRISAVAPKKVASTAVARNRMRRLIYTAVQPLISNMKAGINIIIFAKNEANKASLKDMESDLKNYFK